MTKGRRLLDSPGFFIALFQDVDDAAKAILNDAQSDAWTSKGKMAGLYRIVGRHHCRAIRPSPRRVSLRHWEGLPGENSFVSKLLIARPCGIEPPVEAATQRKKYISVIQYHTCIETHRCLANASSSSLLRDHSFTRPHGAIQYRRRSRWFEDITMLKSIVVRSLPVALECHVSGRAGTRTGNPGSHALIRSGGPPGTHGPALSWSEMV